MFMGSVCAQQDLDLSIVNEKTLVFFNSKQWEELKDIGEESLKQDIDFFTLRYRLGVAYFETKNYFKAIHHFNKGKDFNSQDPYTLEYLYYSYLYAGRKDDALLLTKSMSEQSIKNLDIKKSEPIDFLYFEGGIKISDTSSISNASYFTIGIGSQLNQKIRMYNSFSFMKQDFVGYAYNQYGYVNHLNFTIKNGWSIIPSINVIRQKGTIIEELAPPLSVETDQSQNVVNFYLGLSKSHKRWVFNPSVSIASIKNKSSKLSTDIPPPGQAPSIIDSIHRFANFQIGEEISFVPAIWKGRLLLKVSAYYINGDGASYGQITGGSQLFFHPKFNMDISYTYNSAPNFHANQNTTYYNEFFETNHAVKILNSIYFSKKVSAYLLYKLDIKNNSTFNFNYNTIVGGLKVNF